jgi:tetratricopeptide (TPR) repeat protein
MRAFVTSDVATGIAGRGTGLRWACLLTAVALLVGCAGQGGTSGPEANGTKDPEDQDLQRVMQDTPEQQILFAQEAYAAGRYAAAVQILDVTVDRRPDLADAQRLLGHSLAELGRPEPARAALSKALELGQWREDVLARLVELDRSAGRESDALNHLRLLTLIAPGEPAWRLLYADALSAAGSRQEAERELQTLIDQAPEQAEAYLRLGNLYLERGAPGEAATAYETAWQLGHAAPELPGTLAELWLSLGDVRQALIWHERADAQGKAPDPARRLRMAELRLSVGELEGAQRDVRTALESGASADRARAEALLGRIAHARGDEDGALDHWIAATEGGLRNGDLYAYIGAALFNRQEYRRAARFLAEGIALGRNDASAMRFHALSLIHAGDRTAAAAAVQRYLETFGLDDSARELIRNLEAIRS